MHLPYGILLVRMFDTIGGVPLSTIVIGVRFFGALWASIGISYVVWGFTDFMLVRGGQERAAKGFTILIGFFLVWGLVTLVSHYLF